MRDYKKIDKCSFCLSKDLKHILRFGKVSLAGGFLNKDELGKEKKYPLNLVYCNSCYGLQLSEIIDPKILFSNYFYYSSEVKTLVDYSLRYVSEELSKYVLAGESKVLEIGCNDGLLLKPISKLKPKILVGIEPAKTVIKEINIPNVKLYNNFFSLSTAKDIVKECGNMDLIVANNVYAHIADLIDATKGVEVTLSKNGVFIFDVHYLGRMIDKLQYDMIYHEHIYYYSLLTAQKHFELFDLEIFDIFIHDIHAGSIRFYVCRKNSFYSKRKSKRLFELKKEEIKKGYHLIKTFKKFAKNCIEQREKLKKYILKLKKDGNKIFGYGASGRANCLIQFCNFNKNHIDYIIDDSSKKHGFYLPNSHIKIISNKIIKDKFNRPDYIILFAWAFKKEIMNKSKLYLKNGGKFITPFDI